MTSLQLGACLHAGLRQLHSGKARDELHGLYGISPLAYGLLLVGLAALTAPAWLLIVQLLTFHIGLIQRGLTTYEFIIRQRQKEKALERAIKAGEKPTWGQRRQAWINRNAPCLAVCALCDDAATPAQDDQHTTPPHNSHVSDCHAPAAEQVRARARAPDPATMHNVVGPSQGRLPWKRAPTQHAVFPTYQSRDAQGAYGGRRPRKPCWCPTRPCELLLLLLLRSRVHLRLLRILYFTCGPGIEWYI